MRTFIINKVVKFKGYIARSSNTIVTGILFLTAIITYTKGLIDASAFIGALGAIATIFYGSRKLTMTIFLNNFLNLLMHGMMTA